MCSDLATFLKGFVYLRQLQRFLKIKFDWVLENMLWTKVTLVAPLNLLIFLHIGIETNLQWAGIWRKLLWLWEKCFIAEECFLTSVEPANPLKAAGHWGQVVSAQCAPAGPVSQPKQGRTGSHGPSSAPIWASAAAKTEGNTIVLVTGSAALFPPPTGEPARHQGFQKGVKSEHNHRDHIYSDTHNTHW